MEWKILKSIPTDKRLTPKQQKEVKDAMIQQLKSEHEFYCPLCHRSFDELEEKNRTQALKGKRYTSPIALDHDHETGHIRGLLCTSCNRVEGSINQAITRWGATKREGITEYLRNLIDYLEQIPSPYTHTTHRTPEELKIKRKTRAKTLKRKSKPKTK